MRPVKFLQSLFVSFVLCMSAFGGNIKVPDQNFYLEIKSSHGKPEWFKIYQRGGDWICQTESNPFYIARGNPLGHLDWKALSGQAVTSDCRFKVHIRDTRSSQVHDVEGCARRNESLHQLIEDLNSSCRAG